MKLTRRSVLTASAAVIAAPVIAAESALTVSRRDPFIYGLNTSTIMGQKLPITKVINIAAKAGFRAIEPWISELDAHVKSGGSLADIKKQILDHGMTVESTIGFFDWIVDDNSRRGKALEEAKRNMEMVAQIGGKRIAAPPAGATDQADLNLFSAAERYRALLDLGDQFGVVPQVEIWGFSKCLNRLGAGALVAIESGHPRACILPDVFHLYKGGSNFDSLKLLRGISMHNFHINDYPSTPSRSEINDSFRVLPGDGSAPLRKLYRDLKEIGYTGALSVEVFNRDLWKQDAQKVANAAFNKLRATVADAMVQD